MSGRGTRRHKWALEYASRSKSEGRQLVSSAELLPPLGYTDRTLNESSGGDNSPNLVVKKSWEIALGPIKQIPMNLFIMWMAGNSISIFPIMMVGMMFIRPMQALLAIQQTFKMIEGSQANQQKVVYLLGNLIGLALAIYKCQVMGILPTHPSDWLAFVEPQKRMEWSGGGMVL